VGTPNVLFVLSSKWGVTLLWVLAVLMFIGALVAAVWWLPSVLTRHPSAGLTAAGRLGAENAARGALVAALAVVGAAGLTTRYTWRAAKLTEEGQITDRYTKAIEQLGAGDKLDVRLGGIYALERIARDSARDHPAVMEVLAAFIREKSRSPVPPETGDASGPERTVSPDVQAALAVIGRRNAGQDKQGIDLSGADLTRASLAHAKLSNAKLSSAKLTGADLTGADLTNADLDGANLDDAYLAGEVLAGKYLPSANLAWANLAYARLSRANLVQANLTRANLDHVNLDHAKLDHAKLTGSYIADATLTNADVAGADFTRAILTDADLDHADLSGAHLVDADLARAKLPGAHLVDADLTRALLTDADLTRADLSRAILTDAALTGARWSRESPVPAGWEDDGSGRLKPTGTDSGPTKAK
jgi:uncharacterized protein YjbI with pentapeptide repeats